MSLGLSHIHSVLPFLRRNYLFKRWNICHFTSWWRVPSWYMKDWTIKRNWLFCCTGDKIQLFWSSTVYSSIVDGVRCFRGSLCRVLAWYFWFPNTSSLYIVFFYIFKKVLPILVIYNLVPPFLPLKTLFFLDFREQSLHSARLPLTLAHK